MNRHLSICCVALAIAAGFCDCECDAGRVIVTFEEGKVRIGD